MPALTLNETAALLNSSTDSDKAVNRVCVDTRLLEPGDIFFALPGHRIDGHCFLEQAAGLGAAAFVVRKDYGGSTFGLPCIRVPDVLEALQSLARQVLARSKAQVVAVTGSVGKTTTKGFLGTLLKNKFRTAQSPGNSNSQIGLPLALLNHTVGDEEVVILEMGMTEKGQIAKLVDIAPPDIALLTATSLVHAENFDSLEAVGRAKAEIFSNPKTQWGVLAHDVVGFEEICAGSPCFKVSFSTKSQGADYYLEGFSDGLWVSSPGGATATLNPLKVPGKHNLHNFLGAAVVAKLLGMGWDEIGAAMGHLGLPEKRLEIVEKGGVIFVNDSYNASEISVKAALESMPQPKGKGRKIAVLGEMLELGKFSDGCHRAVAEHALDYVDAVLCCGKACLPIYDVWSGLGRWVCHVKEPRDLVLPLKGLVQEGDVVLLKGSRSNGLWKILDGF